jgi:hypothetical protein
MVIIKENTQIFIFILTYLCIGQIHHMLISKLCFIFFNFYKIFESKLNIELRVECLQHCLL